MIGSRVLLKVGLSCQNWPFIVLKGSQRNHSCPPLIKNIYPCTPTSFFTVRNPSSNSLSVLAQLQYDSHSFIHHNAGYKEYIHVCVVTHIGFEHFRDLNIVFVQV